MTDTEFRDLSFILQNYIIEKLEAIPSSKDRISIHRLICKMIAENFNNSVTLAKLQLSKKTIITMEL